MVTTRARTSPIGDEPVTIPGQDPRPILEVEDDDSEAIPGSADNSADDPGTQETQGTIREETLQAVAQPVNMTMEMLQLLLQNVKDTGRKDKSIPEIRDTKVPDPKRLSSKSIREFEEWIEDVENNIASRPRSYPDEASKVRFAAAWLDGDHRTQWREKKNYTDLETFTFNDFRTWLEDQIESPQNRGINSTIALMNLTQSNNQDPESFYSRYSIIYEKAREGSVRPPGEDIFKYRIFLAKLLPRIRSDITKMGALPPRIADLVATAQRLFQIEKHERLLDRRAGNENDSSNRSGNTYRGRGRPGSDSKPNRKRARASNPNDYKGSYKKPKTSSGDWDKSKITCFRCNKKGHLAPDCKSSHTADGKPIPPKLNAIQAKKEKETEQRPEEETPQ